MNPSAANAVRLVKHLEYGPDRPRWPPGVNPIPFDGPRHARDFHALLADAYVDGSGEVGAFDAWWHGLRSDHEFDPALVFIAMDQQGRLIGGAQCWTSGFVKDLAVRSDRRGEGVGSALLASCFHEFANRGVPAVALKVRKDNPSGAERLYRSLGMCEE